MYSFLWEESSACEVAGRAIAICIFANPNPNPPEAAKRHINTGGVLTYGPKNPKNKR